MRRILGAAVFVIGFAAGLNAQTWRELHQRGEYERAAEVLHQVVLPSQQGADSPVPDVEATETLARLYIDGTGVLQDQIVACSFAQLAVSAAMFRYHVPEHPVVDRIVRLETRACGVLSDDDRLQAVQMMGCPRYGPERQVYSLDADRSVEVSRSGIQIDYQGQQHHVQLLPLGCPQRWTQVRHTRMDGNQLDDGVSTRHLLELFTWIPARSESRRQRALMWQFGEIVGTTVEWHATEHVREEAGSPWMKSAAPADVPAVAFEMERTGAVTWRFVGTQLSGHLEPLPEVATAAAAAPAPQAGTAHVDVAVLDRFGAPLAGATVKLTGVVSREATTNDAGAAAFENLPAGRYDVAASAKSFASSIPRVIDLADSGVTAVAVTLKPHGPQEWITLACGGFDSRSIATLGGGADLVLHVTVTDQQTAERSPAAGDDVAGLTTSNRVRVLQSFKSTPLAPWPGATIAIVQGGGRMDRGDYVDQHSVNGFDPLNVGEDYVLFLKADSNGLLWIHGSQEGAFRIRNGRVEPLGGGGAARAWKARPSGAFFEAVRMRINRQSVPAR